MLTSILKFLATKQVYGTFITIASTWFIYKFICYCIDKVNIKSKDELERKRKNTLLLLSKNVVKYLLMIIMAIVLLNLYGIDTTSIIAGLGVVGVVLGFALQEALKDIIGGVSIIFDNFFVVGDIVQFEDFIGTVTEVGIKSSKIKKYTGEVLTIANRNIDRIINLSQERANVVIKVPTAYEEKSDKVEKVLRSVLKKVKEENPDIDSVDYLGIDGLESSCVLYAVVILCKRGTQWAMRRVLLKEIKDAYDKNKIKIPYTQLEVHNGNKI